MIKNINLELYQFILLILMIYFTVYVWIKSIVNCSNDKYDNIYYENIKLKNYIIYLKKKINNNKINRKFINYSTNDQIKHI
jgi:hypothetical protein